MAQAKRIKMITSTSPRGVFVWPKLNEPDYGSKDHPVPLGQFVVKLRVQQSDPKVQAFLKKMDAIVAKAREEAEEKFAAMKVAARKKLQEKNGEEGIKANPLFTVVYDEETEEPTGEIEFKFQMPYQVEIKKGPKAGKTLTFKPIIVDARGQPIPTSKLPKIYGGTVGIVSFENAETGYFIEGSGLYGVKMRLLGVQIIELVTGGQRDAKSLGFSQQDGFSSDDLPEGEESDEDDKDNEDGGEGQDNDEEGDF